MFKKSILTIFIIITLFAVPATKVKAISILTTTELGVDPSIVTNGTGYGNPDGIVVVPLTLPTSDEKISESKWIRGIYYYTISRLGYVDIPFHYIVTSTGDIYRTNSGGDEKKVSLDGIGSSSIIVGYLNTTNQTTFDTRALKPLSDLLLEISNKNSINPGVIKVSGAKFVKNLETQSVTFATSKVASSWDTDLKKITDVIKTKYVPTPKDYTLQFSNLLLSPDAVNPGDTITASITLKNTGTSGIYGGSSSEILLTKTDNNPSTFFINNIWLSQTQVGLIPEGQVLLPQEEKKFDFKIKAPLYIGDKSETFELRTLSGVKIQTDPIQLKLTMKRTDQKIVEIKHTELGYLRVRATASGAATEIARVTTGERFFVLEDANNGYVKIDIGNGKTGWVSKTYLAYI